MEGDSASHTHVWQYDGVLLQVQKQRGVSTGGGGCGAGVGGATHGPIHGTAVAGGALAMEGHHHTHLLSSPRFTAFCRLRGG